MIDTNSELFTTPKIVFPHEIQQEETNFFPTQTGLWKQEKIAEIEWSQMHKSITDNDFSSSFNKLDTETEIFISNNDLLASLRWLQAAASQYFCGADFEISLLPAEQGEEDLLAFKVFGSFSVSEFRKQRHLLCEAMLAAGHKTLYKIISIFQRRIHDSGRQALSWYRTLSKR